MKTLKVPEMHCEMCVKRITKALADAGIDCEISLADKTVAVDEAMVAAAKAALDDLGFGAEE